jgi:hypothetical protein
MKFKATWIFAVAVAAFGAWVYLDYQGQEKKETQKVTEKQIFPGLSVENLNEITYRNSLGHFTAKKIEGSFQIQEPFVDKVESSEFDTFVTGIAGQDVVKLDTGSATPDWGKYGLEKPDVTIDMVDQKGEKLQIAVGTERTYDDGYYLRKNQSSDVWVGSRGWATYLGKSANDLRSRTLYEGDSLIKGLRILGKNAERSAAVSLSNREGQWKFDGSVKFEASSSATEEFVNLVRHMKADSVVAPDGSRVHQEKYGVHKPALVVELEQGEKKTWTLKLSAENSGQAYAWVGDKRPIYKVQARQLQSLQKTMDDFRDRGGAFRFDVATVQSLRLKKGSQIGNKTGDAKPDAAKKDGQWSSSVAETFLNDLRQLEVRDFKAPAGVKSQLAFVEALNAEGEVVFWFKFGDPRKEKEVEIVTAETNLNSAPFTMEKSKLAFIMDSELK